MGLWQTNDPAQFIQPDAFENDRGIGSVRGARADVNSLSGTHMTENTQWRDHTVRIGASYIGPWDVIGAVSYTYQSGLWSGPIMLRLAEPDPQFGPPTLQLSNGRVVSNPLATTIRFAYPTRGDNQLRLDAMQMLNLRVGKIFRFGAQRLEVAVDGINMTNDDADQRFMTGANQQYNPNYGRGTFRVVPRTAQLSARFLF